MLQKLQKIYVFNFFYPWYQKKSIHHLHQRLRQITTKVKQTVNEIEYFARITDECNMKDRNCPKQNLINFNSIKTEYKKEELHKQDKYCKKGEYSNNKRITKIEQIKS